MKILTTNSGGGVPETPNPPVTLPATIWVVDSNPDGAEGIAWLLRISGYRAIVLVGPSLKIAPITLKPPALIVGVHHGTQEESRSFILDCRALSAGAPLLIITNQRPVAPLELAFDAITVMPPPFDAGKFCSTVHRTLARASRSDWQSAQDFPPGQ